MVVIDAHTVNPDAEVLQPLIRFQQPPEGSPEAEKFDRKQAAAFAVYMYVISKFDNTQDVKHVQLIGASDDGMAAKLAITSKKANMKIDGYQASFADFFIRWTFALVEVALSMG